MGKSLQGRILDGVTLLTALCALGLTASFLWQRTARRQLGSGEASVPPSTVIKDWRIYSAEGHRTGSDTAPITLVEFGDYQCPVCRYFHKSLLAAQREFGDSLAVVYRQLPLTAIHPMAYIAARAAECAGEQGKFWPYHEMLFDSSSWLALGERQLEEYAVETNVPDSARFSKCVMHTGAVATVEQDRRAAAALGISETPTILINDHMIKGAVDSLSLVELIRRLR